MSHEIEVDRVGTEIIVYTGDAPLGIRSGGRNAKPYDKPQSTSECIEAERNVLYAVQEACGSIVCCPVVQLRCGPRNEYDKAVILDGVVRCDEDQCPMLVANEGDGLAGVRENRNDQPDMPGGGIALPEPGPDTI